MRAADQTQSIQSVVLDAYKHHKSINIMGGGSKIFYGRKRHGLKLDLSGHQGVIRYHPSELVITARAGTKLVDIQEVLTEQGQMLAFEPPFFTDSATLGGIVACGFSGCRRPFTGAVRDFVLGCRIINGRGELLSFGGEVMKNVAGYDVSRLMVGAMGTLGVLLEVSLKVLPLPQYEMTCSLICTRKEAMKKMLSLALQALPISGLTYDGERLRVRLSGVESAVRAAGKKTGGDIESPDSDYWEKLNEQKLDFFQSDKTVWRISVAADTPELQLEGNWLYDWGGALRWLISDEDAVKVFNCAAAARGHAVRFRAQNQKETVFQPLTGTLRQLNYNVKKAFDPNGILNPFRMYGDW